MLDPILLRNNRERVYVLNFSQVKVFKNKINENNSKKIQKERMKINKLIKNISTKRGCLN